MCAVFIYNLEGETVLRLFQRTSWAIDYGANQPANGIET